MSMLLQDEIIEVEKRLKTFELATGCELLLVMVNQCDPYPGASWRFGLVGGFISSLIFSYYFDFEHRWLWPVCFLILSLFMTWIGHFKWAKRLALSNWETERECSEKAIELFHTLGTSKVTHKVTAMILVSELERKIEVLVDQKLHEKLSKIDLQELVETMEVSFHQGNKALGFINSIGILEDKILRVFNGKVSDVNSSELSDSVHFIDY